VDGRWWCSVNGKQWWQRPAREWPFPPEIADVRLLGDLIERSVAVLQIDAWSGSSPWNLVGQEAQPHHHRRLGFCSGYAKGVWNDSS
jgi:hypothetical protein